jgi:hypothetical protein
VEGTELKAEFAVGSKIVSFEVSPQPPPVVALSAKACPKSPVLFYTLAYDHLDAERNVAVYRVLESET